MDSHERLYRYIAAILDGLSLGEYDFVHPPAGNAVARETSFDSRAEFPFYPAQTHPHVEMAICCKGRMRVYMRGRWRDCPAGRLLVFPPGVVHSEKAAHRNKSYDLLWIHLSPDVFSMHISAYAPGRGYFVHNPRQAFWPENHARLYDAVAALSQCRAQASDSVLLRCRFQGLLLDCLCHALDQLRQPSSGAESSYREQMVCLVRRQIDRHFAEPLSVKDLAAIAHYTPCYLNTMFKRYVGRSIHQYILDTRLREAGRLLRKEDMSIKQVALAVGFRDPLYFSRIFARRFGKPPRAWC